MSGNSIQPQASLEQLAAVVRDEIQQAWEAWRNALRHAMAAGDALNALQPRIAERGLNWKKWLREHCFVSDRTAQLYQQLARHRDQIEAELRSRGELSLRGARQLIATARDENDGGNRDQVLVADEAENLPEPESLVEHWRRSPGELTALLDAIGVPRILEAMSDAFGCQLRARLPAPKRKSDKPFTKTLNLTTDSTRNGRGTHSRQ